MGERRLKRVNHMLLERPKKAAMTLVPRTGKIPARTSELAGMHPSRRPNIKDPNARQRIYARVKARHAGSVNAIKTKIRDIRRQLERVDNLPADVRVQNERSLAFYQKGLAVAEVEKRRHKMIKKYHMVRFFERQKATRTLKKLRKLLASASTSEETVRLQEKVHEAEVDLNYAIYYPLDQKYIGLYPRKAEVEQNTYALNDEKGEDTVKPPLWTEVEKRMETGKLDELRMSSSMPEEDESDSDAAIENGMKKDAITTNNVIKSTISSSKEVKGTEDGDSDGGFFEE